MTITLILPMTAFALAASISPGPVNLVCLSSGTRYPLSKGLMFVTGAIMQWLNPKAWLASASGIGAYMSGHDLREVIIFAMLYMPICWLSLSCWVYAGVYLRRYIQRPIVLVILNRVLALLLVASCIYLMIG